MQLTLFESAQSDTRPLPLIIAERFGFPLQCHEVDGKCWFAVQDWIAGVARTDEPRDFWYQLQKRLKKAGVELSTWCRQLPYQASNGKTYKLDFATDEGLYLITQRMDAETGLRNEVLRYLAKAGALTDAMRRDPDLALQIGVRGHLARGKSPEWIEERTSGMVARRVFLDAIRDAVYNPNYAQSTNAVYVGLCNHTAAELKQALGLAESANLRDALSSIALAYIRIAEQGIAQQLNDLPELISHEQCLVLIKRFAGIVGAQARQTSLALGRDVFTGQKLIGQVQ